MGKIKQILFAAAAIASSQGVAAAQEQGAATPPQQEIQIATLTTSFSDTPNFQRTSSLSFEAETGSISIPLEAFSSSCARATFEPSESGPHTNGTIAAMEREQTERSALRAIESAAEDCLEAGARRRFNFGGTRTVMIGEPTDGGENGNGFSFDGELEYSRNLFTAPNGAINLEGDLGADGDGFLGVRGHFTLGGPQ